LITGLCVENVIIVEPRAKIRTPIDKKFIDHHCTNPEERPEQRNQVPSPPASMSEPTLEAVEKKIDVTYFALGKATEYSMQIYATNVSCNEG